MRACGTFTFAQRAVNYKDTMAAFGAKESTLPETENMESEEEFS
jgi:hypothetical protein